MIVSKRFKVTLVLALAVLLLVAVVEIPRFVEENTGGSLRNSILRTAEVVIPLKDRILGRTIADKLARFRTTGACQFCDFREANLGGLDLHGADFRRVNLTDANLSEADLDRAQLSGANLTRADLSGTNLTDVNLTGANLTGADLSGTNLTDVNLTGANLTGANMAGANLTRAVLYDVTLTRARLTEADLSEALMDGVDLDSANLTGADLSGTNLTDVNLSETDLSGANLTDANLTRANLSENDLYGTTLVQANLSGANLIGADLSDKDLYGTTLVQANLSGANLLGVDLRDKDLNGKDLNGTNLSRANLIGANLTGANLAGTNLAGANLIGANLARTFLYDAKLVDADLSESNLVGARLSGADLTGANLRGANLGSIDLKRIDGHLGENFFGIKESRNYREVTSFDLSGDVHYLTTKSGILYELKNEESKIVLDLSNDPKFIHHSESGLLSVASNDNFVYISYAIDDPEDNEHRYFLVVDEYSKTFQKVKNIVKIELTTEEHLAGNLVFDNFGKLYLSVGDGGGRPGGTQENLAQNLRSLRGKILRLDVSKTNSEPEIVAYGLRNPWKISIDSKNRMFVGDCGWNTVESVYLIDDLYPTTPYNLGWPVFEGTERRKENSLTFQDTLAPIYEYRHYAAYIGYCVIGGYFLDEPEVYLFGDFSGILRLLKKQRGGKWYEIHSQRTPTDIWSFGYDERSKKLFMSGPSKTFELIMPFEQINRLPQVTICGTTMPDGTINNSGC